MQIKIWMQNGVSTATFTTALSSIDMVLIVMGNLEFYTENFHHIVVDIFALPFIMA